MAKKTHAILVDLLSSKDSDTSEDPGVVVIRVTPPLIPSVYQAVGAITTDRNHVPKYEPAYDVVRIIPHGMYPICGVCRLGGEVWQAKGPGALSYHGKYVPKTQGNLGMHGYCHIQREIQTRNERGSGVGVHIDPK